MAENSTYTSKGQKIIAALFLITGHLPEADPMRLELRDLAVQLSTPDTMLRRELSTLITTLLGAAALARLVSESNARIIEAELKYFADPFSVHDGIISSLFPVSPDVAYKGQLANKRTTDTNMSVTPKSALSVLTDKKNVTTATKSNRQEKILSYINDRKSANIKDISSLFPDVSEKTIQRELSALVASGKIRKHGNKRWSLYVAL